LVDDTDYAGVKQALAEAVEDGLLREVEVSRGVCHEAMSILDGSWLSFFTSFYSGFAVMEYSLPAADHARYSHCAVP
jgi:hypothetical protein